MTQKVILRPMFIELAAMFVAGYVVGKYTQAQIPTIAEARNLAIEASQRGEIIDVEEVLGKKPVISYDGNTINIRIPKGKKK